MFLYLSWLKQVSPRTCELAVDFYCELLVLTCLFSNFCCICVSPIKYFLVFIHPDFCKANLVASNHLSAFWEGMRAFIRKTCPTIRARHNLQLPTTLPYLIINDICLNLQYFRKSKCCFFKFTFKILIKTRDWKAHKQLSLFLSLQLSLFPANST